MRFKLSLFLNYFVFAILLNSVGIVILKSQIEYKVDEVTASLLELFKDLSIAAVSFLFSSFLPKIGYKRAMLGALGIVTVACLTMYFGNSFWHTKLLFACVGVAFGFIKLSVYSSIGLVTKNESEHNALMSSIEGVFMFGVALAYLIFPFFNTETPGEWLRVYLLLAALSLISLILLAFTNFDESNVEANGRSLLVDVKEMWALIAKIIVIVFLISAFLYVMIEQGIMSWLPTFYKRILNMPENIAIIMSSILSISLGLGRIIAGILTSKFEWYKIVVGCLVITSMIVFFVLPKTVSVEIVEVKSIKDVPYIAFTFPLVGLFMASIYPLLNSAILSSLPQRLHSSMTGLIIIFSALGGTLGSRIIGYLFRQVGADKAFYYLLIPILLLIVSVLTLNRIIKRQKL